MIKTKKGVRPNDLQQARGCRHVEMVHRVGPSFKYGDKVPFVYTYENEVPCDLSCGGRK